MKRPVPMNERRNYRRAKLAMLALWDAAKDQPGYNKRQWIELEQAIYMLATDGAGEPLPPEGERS